MIFPCTSRSADGQVRSPIVTAESSARPSHKRRKVSECLTEEGYVTSQTERRCMAGERGMVEGERTRN